MCSVLLKSSELNLTLKTEGLPEQTCSTKNFPPEVYLSLSPFCEGKKSKWFLRWIGGYLNYTVSIVNNLPVLRQKCPCFQIK